MAGGAYWPARASMADVTGRLAVVVRLMGRKGRRARIAIPHRQGQHSEPATERRPSDRQIVSFDGGTLGLRRIGWLTAEEATRQLAPLAAYATMQTRP